MEENQCKMLLIAFKFWQEKHEFCLTLHFIDTRCILFYTISKQNHVEITQVYHYTLDLIYAV